MLLVTGETGNIGRELVRELGGVKFRALVRSGPLGVDHVVADLDEPGTLPSAFDGVDKLFLLTPGIGTDHTAHAVAAAQAAGVSHIVAVSSTNVLGDPMPAMGRWHHEREEIIRASGIPATILRPGGFATNALDWVRTIREDGYVLDPIGPGRYLAVPGQLIARWAGLLVLTLTGDRIRAITRFHDNRLPRHCRLADTVPLQRG